ncbi:hypothetical protein [Agromyces humi]|uniref:hypothetical protein n=1 Tax=Agromyces humi TaxID=1766800 RepID=UPI00135CA736|nr:hypothetical protein [Agromyces humi]
MRLQRVDATPDVALTPEAPARIELLTEAEGSLQQYLLLVRSGDNGRGPWRATVKWTGPLSFVRRTPLTCSLVCTVRSKKAAPRR